MHLWQTITHFGAAGLLAPLAALIALGLWFGGQHRALWAWLLALSAGSALVLTTKIAFMGWGVGSATFNFTGISGHATLATAIIPMALAMLLSPTHRRSRLGGLILGLLVGALVSWSRVRVGAHSVSEVVAGFALGAAISLVAIRVLHPPRSAAPRWAAAMGFVSLVAFHPILPAAVPTHTWEERLALALSGRDAPYSRHMLLRSAPVDL